MWKPGQSGNPSGVGAYLEAMPTPPLELSPGAERTRRWRSQQQHGLIVVSLDVPKALADKLVSIERLDATERADKEAIATALIAVVESVI
jgi:hypothetical protein